MCILNTHIIAFAVVVLLWLAVADASKSCMTKMEARKVYRTSHLYWHGKGHCWDASPRTSHRHQNKVRRTQVEASHKAEAKPEPKVTPDEVDTSPPPRAERTLKPDDLRTWANSMAAMTGEPIMTILDRWPDQELPQRRTKPTAIDQPSRMNARTIIMAIIVIMVLLAVLIEVTVRRRPSHTKVQ
jgi:hypothetical protein